MTKCIFYTLVCQKSRIPWVISALVFGISALVFGLTSLCIPVTMEDHQSGKDRLILLKRAYYKLILTMAQVFDGISIPTFRWCPPPVDSIVFKECPSREVSFGSLSCMNLCPPAWSCCKQCILEDLDVKVGIHPSLKYPNVCWAIPAASGPNVNHHCVFWVGLQTGWLACFAAAILLV